MKSIIISNVIQKIAPQFIGQSHLKVIEFNKDKFTVELEKEHLDILILAHDLTFTNANDLFLSVKNNLQDVTILWFANKANTDIPSKDFYQINIYNKYVQLDAFTETNNNINALYAEVFEATISELSKEKINDFNKVDINIFREHNYVSSNVYLKLSPSKIIKIINSNELFNQDFIKKFIDKGVKYLYIKKDDYYTFSEFISGTISAKYKTPKTSIIDDIKDELEGVMVLHDLIHNLNIDSPTVKTLNEVIVSNIQTVKKYPHLKIIVDKFTLSNNKNYLYDHSLMLSYITNLMALKMSWATTATLQKLSMASILHDVALDNEKLAQISRLDEINHKDFSWKEINKLKKHPQEGYYLLEQLKDIPPDAATLVLHHHETPDGQGYPKGLDATQIPQICCLFIIAENIVNKLYGLNSKLGDDKVREIVQDFNYRYNRGNFKRPLEGFIKIIEDLK
ncbi:MAG: HD domain-containing protein [Oligoflexia bacterium]|nr:HD domain-containing protein [Oligoflexia bacterium]